jgi:hypothetical protein
MTGLLFAIAVAFLGVLASYWFFGVRRRREAETDAGVRSLANMKWRECMGLVMESLHADGYEEEHSTRQPGEGGTEFLLRQGGENVLLSYKHGTAYRIGEANVRDFASAVQMQGAKAGILITLGQAEDTAHGVARKYGIKLIDGAALWPRVDRYVSPNMRAAVRHEAMAATSKGLYVGAIISLLVGIVSFFVMQGMAPQELPPAARETPLARPKPTGPTEQERLAAQITETQRALEEVASLTDEQRLQRRADAASKVSAITQVDNAAWGTQSTLVLRLSQTDGKDALLIDEVCRTLIQYEELRYTRVQLEPPLTSTVPVRWRQCQ